MAARWGEHNNPTYDSELAKQMYPTYLQPDNLGKCL